MLTVTPHSLFPVIAAALLCVRVLLVQGRHINPVCLFLSFMLMKILLISCSRAVQYAAAVLLRKTGAYSRGEREMLTLCSDNHAATP
jgi:hypothetical protein